MAHCQSHPIDKSVQGGSGAKFCAYLELLKRETAASPGTAVVLDGRASHNRSEKVDGTGGDGGSLGPTGVPTPDLGTGL